MIDFGPDELGWTGGERGIRDLLEVAADYIDYAKIYAMNALLIPAETVARTTRLYLDAGVTPFAGGILFEYAWQRHQVEELIKHLQRLGIPGLEISENYVTLSADERHRLIERFQKSGLSVVYEFGRKNPEQPMSLPYLGGLVNAVAEHGIHHVTIEQCEIDLLAQESPDALLAGTARGLYVTDMMGFGFNAVTGDFSRGASGFWIENGQLTFPVSEVTISSNLDAMLKGIDAIASDLDFKTSTASPTFRVPSMTIAGT